MPITEKLKERVKQSEGWRPHIYKCPEDKWTIGYGFNIEDNKLPRQVADLWLDLLLEQSRKELLNSEHRKTFLSLSQARQEVLIDMVYNIGLPSLLGFRRMWDALSNHEYSRAAVEMLDSKWADQVKGRAQELAYTMETGVETG